MHIMRHAGDCFTCSGASAHACRRWNGDTRKSRAGRRGVSLLGSPLRVVAQVGLGNSGAGFHPDSPGFGDLGALFGGERLEYFFVCCGRVVMSAMGFGHFLAGLRAGYSALTAFGEVASVRHLRSQVRDSAALHCAGQHFGRPGDDAEFGRAVLSPGFTENAAIAFSDFGLAGVLCDSLVQRFRRQADIAVPAGDMSVGGGRPGGVVDDGGKRRPRLLMKTLGARDRRRGVVFGGDGIRSFHQRVEL